MDWQSQLISDYIATCEILQIAQKESPQKRRSNNPDQGISDAEITTIFISGYRSGARTVKSIHRRCHDFLLDWFPKLPSYEQFIFRANQIVDKLVTACYLMGLENQLSDPDDTAVIDSMPITVASSARCSRAKAAKGLANVGYCSSKKMFYYGVKLHAAVSRRNLAPYIIQLIVTTSASTHDLEVLKTNLEEIDAENIYGDKAYISKELDEDAADISKKIARPQRKPRYGDLNESAKQKNREISSVRQVVESAFGWFQEKTGIANANKVRSRSGLLRHVYMALFCCMSEQFRLATPI